MGRNSHKLETKAGATLFRTIPFLALLAALAAGPAARAQTPAEFYRGKTVKIMIAGAPGAAYDFVGRVLAAHIGKYIPGNPAVLVENVPGAASLVLLNNTYNKAARDGTVFSLSLNGVVLEPRLKVLSREGGATNFDLSRMEFVGTPTQQPQVLWVFHKTPFQTAADLTKIKAIMGSTAPGGDNSILPALSNVFLGTKMEVVTGYPSVNNIFLASETGEVHGGTVNYSSLAGKTDWVAEKKARVLLQFGVERIPELPDVPTAIELARDEVGRQALRVYALKYKTTYPFILPPGVPPDRIAILRAAFMATMKDPGFIEDSRRIGVDVNPLGGEEIRALMREIDAAPEAAIDSLRKILN